MGIHQLKTKLRRLRAKHSSEAGQGLAEYGLILALIAVVCIGALTTLGVSIAGSDGFVNIGAAL